MFKIGQEANGYSRECRILRAVHREGSSGTIAGSPGMCLGELVTIDDCGLISSRRRKRRRIIVFSKPEVRWFFRTLEMGIHKAFSVSLPFFFGLHSAILWFHRVHHIKAVPHLEVL